MHSCQSGLQTPLLIPFNSNTETTSYEFRVINDLLNLHPSLLQIFKAKVSSSWLWTVTIFAQVLSVHHVSTLHIQTQSIIHLALNEMFWFNLLLTSTVTPTCSPHLSSKHSFLRLVSTLFHPPFQQYWHWIFLGMFEVLHLREFYLVGPFFWNFLPSFFA